MPATLAKTIKIADSYALGDLMQPTLDSQGQGRPRGTPTAPGDQGNTIALITGTREEMKGRITGMERRK
jgi:hypothetical protein